MHKAALVTRLMVCVVLGLVWAAPGAGQTPDTAAGPRDQAVYADHLKYPVIEEMSERDREVREKIEAKTAEILATVAEEKKARKEERKSLRFSLDGIAHPDGPDAFTTRLWHTPPTPQYLTGTCWSFATTSFLESEIKRQTGQEIKLSEMWSVYWEYVAKARGFIASRGSTLFEEGSQSAAVIRALSEHGIVPRRDYEGVLAEDGRFDHGLMASQMSELLHWCADNQIWDEDLIIGMIRAILDKNMGRPPETVRWDGTEYTPQDFLTRICQLDPSAYVELMSTLSEPMWAYGEYRVPDNWWHGHEYANVPLDVWYGAILKAIESGYTVAIGGDVSEPGLFGPADIAVVPSFDIPGSYIDQSSRELRFYNRTTTDDHGIHLVGHMVLDGHDWFLIKDSNRSSRLGTFKGYYMYRDDYVRLKMLTFMVHRDVVADILAKVAPAEEPEAGTDEAAPAATPPEA